MKKFPATLSAATRAIKTQQISSSELVEQTLHQIKTWEPHLHAFLETFEEQALQEARQHDQKPMPGLLAGVPIAVKDLICTNEGHTTAGSKILENFRSPFQATVIARLKKAGAIIIGKTNLDEFAMGSSTEYSAFGVTKNPWDTTRVAGGSSGGSAAAVASGEVLGALGTDTGGSIRQPASFCGVVGIKPTYGRVSRFGVIAYGSSLDQVGAFGKTVQDTALLLQVLAGQDAQDATSSPQAVPDYVQACTGTLQGVRVGVPKEFFGQGIDPEVEKVIRAAIQQLEKLGASIKEISLPLTSAGVAVYFLIAKAEASTNLARYDGLRFSPLKVDAGNLLERYMKTRGQGFGPEVKRAILMGTYTLSAGYYDAWYKQASKVRTLIRREYEQAFQEVDVIAGPVAPEAAFPIGSKADDPLAMYLSDALTVPLSVAGVPALSVPAGFVYPERSETLSQSKSERSEGRRALPVGLQLAAPHFEESRLFTVGNIYEQSQDWFTMSPSIE